MHAWHRPIIFQFILFDFNNNISANIVDFDHVNHLINIE